MDEREELDAAVARMVGLTVVGASVARMPEDADEYAPYYEALTLEFSDGYRLTLYTSDAEYYASCLQLRPPTT